MCISCWDFECIIYKICDLNIRHYHNFPNAKYQKVCFCTTYSLVFVIFLIIKLSLLLSIYALLVYLHGSRNHPRLQIKGSLVVSILDSFSLSEIVPISAGNDIVAIF